MSQEPPEDISLSSSVDVSAGISDSTVNPAYQPASFLKATGHFAESMAKFVASGFKVVKEEGHRLRMEKCEPCEYRRDSRCTLCRCFIDKKAWLPHEDCPIGRWPV